MSAVNFQSPFTYKLIYVFRINDEAHRGYLKIGEATIKTDRDYSELRPSSTELNAAARARIDEYTSTAGIRYELLYTEVAVKNKGQKSVETDLVVSFRDHDVHDVLLRSGIERIQFDTHKKQNEWFRCDLETAKRAIKAVKENRRSLSGHEITQGRSPIVFRPEQEEAVQKTLKTFKRCDRMLWNAKMRFGKTLTALEVAKRSGFRHTIIITHRPVVEKGWYDDFNKIFYDRSDYVFGSKEGGESLSNLIHGDKKFVYFASMQDLRGSEEVGGNIDKNNDVFRIDWDFVVVDEAHEGTQTKLGQAVLQKVIKKENGHVTKTLELSGTPFNLLESYKDDDIYTWDYIMEQEAKRNWSLRHYGDSNPYEELPKLNIYTYHLEETFRNYQELEDKAFDFREFFRVWRGSLMKDGKKMPEGVKVGDFVHKEDIQAFLNLICKESNKTNYPYSTQTYRDYFRHTLWVVPGVWEAKALSSLLKAHPVFSQFEIVNVAGEGDEEIDTHNALKAVQGAMTKHPESTRTITISCGRLTTGVTVPEWTAVLMLAGSYSTAATQYLQTIFRVQSPANIDGKIKENCYVFDFAPDRTLKMLAGAVQLSQKGMGNESARVRLGSFLNFCPVISISESSMVTFKVSDLLRELKKAYIERVTNNGFDDPKLYNDNLLKLNELELREFDNLKGIIGKSKAMETTKSIDINNEGFSDEEYEEIERIQRKPKKELTEEEKKRLEELKEKRKQKGNAISILRGISIRIPLLIYGADVPFSKTITIEEFPNLVDDSSWVEFMPKGVTKDLFHKFSKYYDPEVFEGSAGRIRAIARATDDLEPTERIKRISQIFSTFRNPDKETVLTPWRVVNMHMSDTIGGYDFWDEPHREELDSPRFVNQEGVTDRIFVDDGKVLEINSKTGLYPLYVAYSFYRHRIGDRELTLQERLRIWDEVVRDNIFVICKTPMAKQITKRTLLGYRGGKINAHAYEDLINQLKEKKQQFVDKVTSCNFWNKEGNRMKFNAIVGNPPYTDVNGGAKGQSGQAIYQHFVLQSIKIKPLYVSLIIPSRWMLGGGPELKQFRNKMIDDTRIKSLFDYIDADAVFSNVNIKGGICYFLWSSDYSGKCKLVTINSNNTETIFKYLKEDECDFIFRNEHLSSIYKKVSGRTNKWLNTIVSANDPFGFDKRQENSMRRVKPIFNLNKNKDDIEFYYNGWKQKGIGYISQKMISKGSDLIWKWKVFVPKAWGTGKFGTDKLTTCFVGKPGSCCTETYLVVGPFDSKEEAINCCHYLSTCFFLTLISLKKITQNCMQDCYSTVPLVSFKNPVTDDMLYQMFSFSSEEISYINNKFMITVDHPLNHDQVNK